MEFNLCPHRKLISVLGLTINYFNLLNKIINYFSDGPNKFFKIKKASINIYIYIYIYYSKHITFFSNIMGYLGE